MFLLVFSPRANAESVREPVVLEDTDGKVLARGTAERTVEGDRMTVRVLYSFPQGRQIEERTELRVSPTPMQTQWSWEEREGSRVVRQFHVDLVRGTAHGLRVQDGKTKTWDRKVKIEPGRTFAGLGVIQLIQTQREELAQHPVSFKAVVFTPKPRVITVKVSRAGEEVISRGRTREQVDHYVIHPQLGWLAQALVQPPDYHVWLDAQDEGEFIRAEGPLLDPSDPVVSVTVMPTASRAARSAPR